MFRQRKKWFVPLQQVHQALWWVPASHQPIFAEGKARLKLLDRFGPTPKAFSFQ